METGIFTYRHAGTFDWERLYREGKQYFKDALGKPEFTESKYKTKSDEIEGVWKIGQNYDAYHRFQFEVEFKVIDVKQVVVDGKPMMEGKARWWISGELVENFEDKNPAGKREIFQDMKDPKTGKDKPSWLHKAYKRVTFKDRDEVLEGFPFGIIDGYIALLKRICGAAVAQ